MRQQLYPQARQSIVLPQPKLVAEVKRQGSLSPVLGGRLVSTSFTAMKHANMASSISVVVLTRHAQAPMLTW